MKDTRKLYRIHILNYAGYFRFPLYAETVEAIYRKKAQYELQGYTVSEVEEFYLERKKGEGHEYEK